MADNVAITPGSGATIATDDIGGVNFQRVKLTLGADGVDGGDVASGNPLPVTGPLTDTQLRATPVPVSGTVTITDGSGPVTVDGTVSVTGVATETTLATVLTTTAFQARTPALGQAAMAASSPVVIASDQSAVAVNQAGVSATGSLAALNAAVALSLTGMTGFALDVRGTFVATIVVEGTVDGTNWITLSVVPIGAALNVAQVASVTAAGAWWGNANGLQQVRARASAYTSGSATIVLRAMQAAGMVLAVPTGQTTVAVSGTVTANIGTGSIAAGTNAIGDVGIQARANATGAATIHHFVAAATTNALNIKASAGRVLGWSLANTTASWRYVKLHNTAGAPTAGAGVVATIGIPPNGVNVQNLPVGLGFATGIARTCVTGAADADATATAANDVVGDIFFA